MRGSGRTGRKGDASSVVTQCSNSFLPPADQPPVPCKNAKRWPQSLRYGLGGPEHPTGQRPWPARLQSMAQDLWFTFGDDLPRPSWCYWLWCKCWLLLSDLCTDLYSVMIQCYMVVSFVFRCSFCSNLLFLFFLLLLLVLLLFSFFFSSSYCW